MAKKVRLPFKFWELILILFALCLSGGSLAIYTSGLSLRSLFLGLNDGGSRSKIGVLASQNGVTRRQFGDETEFRPLGELGEVFNQDTIVTESSGRAVIQLDEGSSIELGPSTMVRLAFETSLSLGGISRSANVEVVSGEVSGKSDKETKTPKVFIKTRDRIIPITKIQKEVVHVEAVVKPLFVPPPKPAPIPVPVAKPVPIVLPPPPPPEPSPSPLPSPSVIPSPLPQKVEGQVKLLTPLQGERLSVTNRVMPLERAVTLTWEVKPANQLSAQAQPVLVKRTKDAKGQTVSEDPIMDLPEVLAVKGRGSIVVKLNKPGRYVWKVGKQVRGFEILPEVEVLNLLDPLVGGQTATDNAYHGELIKDFNVTLRWTPVEGVEDYRVRITKDSQSKVVLLDKQVPGSQYLFNSGKTLIGTVYYKVTCKHPSEFFLSSEIAPFSFTFMPPKTVMPVHDEQIALATLLKEGPPRLLVTWEKTNFTSYYELVVAHDPGFRSLVIKKTMRENFWIMPDAKAGEYWWRVRGISEDRVSSHYSRGAHFTIK